MGECAERVVPRGRQSALRASGVYPRNALGVTRSLSHAWVGAIWARRCHGYAELASATLWAETPRMTGERSVDVAAASGTLHVALLGGFSVRVGSRAVPGSWRLRKSKTLVKLLALAGGHRAHRDVLAGVLWPGLDPAAAANNLHQALHAARRALASDRSPSADALCLRDDIVILWPDGDLIVDADVFAAAAQRALRSGSVEDYGAALKLYAGELLPEDRYADWAAPHRERLAALHEALAAGQARALLERRSPKRRSLCLSLWSQTARTMNRCTGCSWRRWTGPGAGGMRSTSTSACAGCWRRSMRRLRRRRR